MNISKAERFEKLVKAIPASAFHSTRPGLRILQVFLNADLRGSHNSLTLLGAAHRIDLPNLKKGLAVVFINRTRTLMKVFVAGNTFAFTRRDRIDVEAIKHLPEVFGAVGEINYDAALRILLEEKLGKKAVH